jgi:hypothetical protein
MQPGCQVTCTLGYATVVSTLTRFPVDIVKVYCTAGQCVRAIAVTLMAMHRRMTWRRQQCQEGDAALAVIMQSWLMVMGISHIRR